MVRLYSAQDQTNGISTAAGSQVGLIATQTLTLPKLASVALPPPPPPPQAVQPVELYGDTSAAAADSSGTTTVTATILTPTGKTSTSPFTVNITWDSAVAKAPAAFKAGVIAAVQTLESEITSPVTINISVGYGEIGGSTMASGALGESSAYLDSVSYSALLGALKTHNSDATTASVIASLPSTMPVSGTVLITTAEAKALGLMGASSATDAYVGFGANYPFTYNDATGVAAGTYDFTGVVLHELTETMGRILLTGANIAGGSDYSLLDLLHYSAAGKRDFSGSTPGYFSANGGVTNGGTFNTASGGDTGDLASSMGNNSFDAFSSSGVVNAFTAGDLTEMNALGWSTATTPVPPPTGVTLTAITADTGLQSGAKLAGGKALLSVVQTGGVSGDGFTYALSGNGASGFALSSAGTLSTTATGTAGSAGGTLYALDVTATDSTAKVASAGFPLQVVVGGGAAGVTVSIAKLVGFSASAPSFIYPGSGANGTFDATGLTARADFFAGTGADTFIGGSGVNDYIFGSTSDSLGDLIKNFSVAKDLLDFTGLSAKLTYDGAVTGSSLGKDSVGYQFSGGNTYVYVNTSSASEVLTKANLKVELSGVVNLTSANIVHL